MWPFTRKDTKTGSSDLIDIDKAIYRTNAHHRVGDALLHLKWARESAQRNETDRARVEYLKCVESWKQANDAEAGKWTREHELAKKEYEQFVLHDPLYITLSSRLLPLIDKNPGVLQTEVYAMLPSIPREHISYVLYFAAATGVITRTKKGRTYQLRLGNRTS